jgi:hypothetical protein
LAVAVVTVGALFEFFRRQGAENLASLVLHLQYIPIAFLSRKCFSFVIRESSSGKYAHSRVTRGGAAVFAGIG